MKYGSTFFLKVVIVAIAMAVLAAMLWLPQTEGRAANLDLIGIYSDPLIIYTYAASIPFFIGLYQAFKLLNLIDTNKAFSRSAVSTLGTMKLSFLSLVGFIALALLYIRLVLRGEDSAGVTMLGVIAALVFSAIASAAGVFQRLFQNAVKKKL